MSWFVISFSLLTVNNININIFITTLNFIRSISVVLFKSTWVIETHASLQVSVELLGIFFERSLVFCVLFVMVWMMRFGCKGRIELTLKRNAL